MPTVSALSRPKQEDHKFKASLSYVGRTYLNKTRRRERK
jgi:hypothetical protein